MPVYGWLNNLHERIAEAFGLVHAFEDRYEFDLVHLFTGFQEYDPVALENLKEASGGKVEPAALLELELQDVSESIDSDVVSAFIDHHKTQRSRLVYVQTPGIFEFLSRHFGIENHLMYLVLNEDALHEVYRRQAKWNQQFAMACLDLGVDMIHVSDDWGSQASLMFSPDTWRRMIYPYHKSTCDAVKARGGLLSLHSDGNVSQALDGIVELGYDVVHPYQESAGMDFALYLKKYRNSFSIMGGLDVQTTLGFGRYDELKAEIERLVAMFRDGGLILCTSHMVQEHCSIDELVFAYDLIYKLVRE